MGSAVKSLYEAKTQLSRLVDRAANGEEFVIAKNGVPMAKLVPLSTETRKRQPGCWQGRIWIADDFDAHLPPEEVALWEKGAVEPGVSRSAPKARARRRR